MMNITTLDKLSLELWKRLYGCTAFVIATAAMLTFRMTVDLEGPTPFAERKVEAALWRLALLVIFHSAPGCWAFFIYRGYKLKQISIPLFETLQLLRMPIAAWSGGCLLIALIFWPQLTS